MRPADIVGEPGADRQSTASAVLCCSQDIKIILS
jgi:hypothetical protein